MTSKRVFIGPHDVAGYYANLSRGLREIGMHCDFITYAPHPYGYGGESPTPRLLKIARFFNRWRGNIYLPKPLRVLIALPAELLTNTWAFIAAFRYDVYIFGFGTSLGTYRNWDLILLKWLNKRVISHLNHGSEARPPFIDGFIQDKDGRHYPSIEHIHKKTNLTRERVRRVQKRSSVVVGAPFSTTYFSEGIMVNTFALGVPFAGADIPRSLAADHNDASSTGAERSVRILHSPSHPAGKGSRLISQAIQRLQEKGHAIEFVQIHGRPNVEVLQEIQRCDFVVDQLYSDFPLAGFATEAAWYGKPAVVGGYGLTYLRTLAPESMWPPSKICHPDDIEHAIEDLIVNRQERMRIGADVQRFVREKWNSSAFAQRYKQMIEGQIPPEWWLDPKAVIYVEGCGQDIERTRSNVREMVSHFGFASLNLRHRPDLERAFLDFSKQ